MDLYKSGGGWMRVMDNKYNWCWIDGGGGWRMDEMMKDGKSWWRTGEMMKEGWRWCKEVEKDGWSWWRKGGDHEGRMEIV